MSENEKQKQPVSSETNHQQVINATQPARRRLLKGTVAIPVIMTLHSGAALARSSNLVGAITDVNQAATVTSDLGTQIVCVNPGDGPLESGGSTYDLGDTPAATLGDISQDLAAQAQNCQAGGGILISGGAFSSLQGRGFFTDL